MRKGLVDTKQGSNMCRVFSVMYSGRRHDNDFHYNRKRIQPLFLTHVSSLCGHTTNMVAGQFPTPTNKGKQGFTGNGQCAIVIANSVLVAQQGTLEGVQFHQL